MRSLQISNTEFAQGERRHIHAFLRRLETENPAWSSRRPGRRQDCPLRYTPGEDGRLFITPECTSYEEIEGRINALKDEVDEIRERARQAFQVT